MTLRSLVIVAVLLYATGSDALIFEKVRVEIINDMNPSAELSVHCKSGDDDLGPHVLQNGDSYSFKFRVNFIQSTQFYCNFQWTSNGAVQSHWFDIYDALNLKTSGCNKCIWKIRQNNLCRIIAGKSEDSCCFPWKRNLLRN